MARIGAAVGLLLAACRTPAAPPAAPPPTAPLAADYVRLVLAVGEHDPAFVDAYYGPPAWREDAAREAAPLAELALRAGALHARAAQLPRAGIPELEVLRHAYLERQLAAVQARIAMLQGQRFSFDAESQALYDATAPHHDAAYFQRALDQLAARLPGPEPLLERFERWRKDFLIPAERLDQVFRAAIEECRRRTLRYIELPPAEDFVVEYVQGKSWSAYNWYQGGGRSVIQVNTDLPIGIDRAIDLACHEGYPGHHVYNALLEHHLVQGKGWVEFSVYPLFSPQSLIAEGSANYGIEVAFPGHERLAFERDVLFPLAGLDPARAAEHAEVQALATRLRHAGNEAARRYLDGAIDRAQAERWLQDFALMSPESAARRVRFMDEYRSYVINYNLGQDLVQAYIERRIGPEGTPAARWEAFQDLLASPRLPSGLE